MLFFFLFLVLALPRCASIFFKFVGFIFCFMPAQWPLIMWTLCTDANGAARCGKVRVVKI